VIHHGDCIEAMREMDEASVEAVVTDPPYHLTFMGRAWDHAPSPRESQVMHEAWATEALRVLKPGGHMLAAGSSRTFHRLVCAIEDAGFEVRDTITHHYGSGFPKSLDVSKAIDKAAGAERTGGEQRLAAVPTQKDIYNTGKGNRLCEACGKWTFATNRCECSRDGAPATPEAEQWQGWGTALKPATEFWCVAPKPLVGTVARNVLEHGTGAINVDACRVEGKWTTWRRKDGSIAEGGEMPFAEQEHRRNPEHPSGRWPPNAVFSHAEGCQQVGTRRVKGHKGYPNGPGGDKGADYRQQREEVTFSPSYGKRDNEPWQGHADPDGTEEVEAWTCAEDCPVAELDRQSGERPGASSNSNTDLGFHGGGSGRRLAPGYGDTGGASRYFPTFRYVAKASRRERSAGLDGDGKICQCQGHRIIAPCSGSDYDSSTTGSGSRPTGQSSTEATSSTAAADRATSSATSSSAGNACPSCGGVVGGALRNAHPT
jgi:site-specific DNA-methyltransferase (adenine-specific)